MTSSLDNDFDPPARVVDKPASRADILGALRWSVPVERPTRNGPRIVTKAAALVRLAGGAK